MTNDGRVAMTAAKMIQRKKIFHRNLIDIVKGHHKVVFYRLFSRAVLTALLFKWECNFGWSLTKSRKYRLLADNICEISMNQGSWLVNLWWSHDIGVRFDWKGNDTVVSKRGNDRMIGLSDKGDQELSKTFCGLKIGPLLRKLQAFKDW